MRDLGDGERALCSPLVGGTLPFENNAAVEDGDEPVQMEIDALRTPRGV